MNRESRRRPFKLIALPAMLMSAACGWLVVDGLWQRSSQLSQFEIPTDHSARAMLEFMRQANGSVQVRESFFESSNLKAVCQAIEEAHEHLVRDAGSLSVAEKREASFYNLRYAAAAMQHGLVAGSEETIAELLSDTREFLSSAEPITSKESQLALGTVVLLESLGRLEQEREFAEWLQQRLSQTVDAPNRAMQELTKTASDVLNRLSWLGQKLELQSRTLDDQPFDMEGLRGRVALIEFWGTRCQPCIADFPALKRIYSKYHKQGFEIVAICLNAAPSRIGQVCKQHDVPWIQLCHEQAATEECNDELMQRFGIQSVPTTMLVDRDGQVIAMGLRPLTGDDRDLERWLDKLLP